MISADMLLSLHITQAFVHEDGFQRPCHSSVENVFKMQIYFYVLSDIISISRFKHPFISRRVDAMKYMPQSVSHKIGTISFFFLYVITSSMNSQDLIAAQYSGLPDRHMDNSIITLVSMKNSTIYAKSVITYLQRSTRKCQP